MNKVDPLILYFCSIKPFMVNKDRDFWHQHANIISWFFHFYSIFYCTKNEVFSSNSTSQKFQYFIACVFRKESGILGFANWRWNEEKCLISLILIIQIDDIFSLISKEEFLGEVGRDHKRRLSTDEKAEIAFKVFDKNHDGFITKGEMLTVSKNLTKEQVRGKWWIFNGF